MAASDSKKLRILFADDERTLRELMRLELPRLGHEAVVCEDGRAAVAALEKNHFDCALLDIRMPGLPGIDVLKRIREISPEIEVVLLTGHATVETAVESLRFGAFDYLTKPCKM
ncbi:MAG: response regulator, partial [Planctomycetia bacterium]